MENIIPFITSPIFSGALLALKVIFLIITSLFFVAIVFFLVKSSWFKYLIFQDTVEIFTYRPYGLRKIVKQWRKITGRLETGMESEYKLAIIEADSTLDDILKRMGYGGKTLGERLDKLTTIYLPNLEQTREAHKIRNNIVHDPDYRLPLDQARSVLAIYERALRDLQAF